MTLTHATLARQIADSLARNAHGVAQGLLNTRNLFVATGQQHHSGQVFLALAARHRPAEMVAMRLFHGWSFRSITLLMRATLYREEWTTSLVHQMMTLSHVSSFRLRRRLHGAEANSSLQIIESDLQLPIELCGLFAAHSMDCSPPPWTRRIDWVQMYIWAGVGLLPPSINADALFHAYLHQFGFDGEAAGMALATHADRLMPLTPEYIGPLLHRLVDRIFERVGWEHALQEDDSVAIHLAFLERAVAAPWAKSDWLCDTPNALGLDRAWTFSAAGGMIACACRRLLAKMATLMLSCEDLCVDCMTEAIEDHMHRLTKCASALRVEDLCGLLLEVAPFAERGLPFQDCLLGLLKGIHPRHAAVEQLPSRGPRTRSTMATHEERVVASVAALYKNKLDGAMGRLVAAWLRGQQRP